MKGVRKIISLKGFIKIVAISGFVLAFYNIKVYAIDTILRVAFEPNLPPYQFEENGEYIGMHIDILNSIAEKNKFIIEYIPMKTNTKCLEALENGRVDMVLGVKKIDEFKHIESISQSYMCVITSNENIENVSKKISVASFSAALENETVQYAFVQNLANLRYIVTSNQVKAFDLLVSQKADLLIGVKHSVLYQLEKANLDNDYTVINNYIVPIEYTVEVKDGQDELIEKFNTSMRQLRISGEYENIYDKWINEDSYIIRKLIEKIMIISLVILTIGATVFIFNFRLSFLLKKQVNEKTEELRKTNKYLEEQIIQTQNNSELRNHVVENSPSGIIVFDKNYNITLFNKSACKLMNIDELPLGKNIFEICLMSKILVDKKEKVLFDENRFLNEEITFKAEDGQDISYRYDIYQLYDFEGNIRGAILSFDNITEEIQIKEEIYEREKNRALNQIIAGIAHEIRNPLTSIKTFVELIPIKIKNEDFQNSMLEIVPKEVDRVSNLIKNLIDYAKPDNRNKVMVNVNEVIKSSTDLMEHMLKYQKITLNVDVENDLFIMADTNQIKQVLINIILNGFESMMSIKSQNEKLYMDIKAWRNEKNIFVQIVDEGTGMTDEEIKKCVEPFFTTKSSGTGLGLYISKQYVEENKGSMTIESDKNVYTKITLKFRRIE